jgi:hypothetical protein
MMHCFLGFTELACPASLGKEYDQNKTVFLTPLFCKCALKLKKFLQMGYCRNFMIENKGTRRLYLVLKFPFSSKFVD